MKVQELTKHEISLDTRGLFWKNPNKTNSIPRFPWKSLGSFANTVHSHSWRLILTHYKINLKSPRKAAKGLMVKLTKAKQVLVRPKQFLARNRFKKLLSECRKQKAKTQVIQVVSLISLQNTWNLFVWYTLSLQLHNERAKIQKESEFTKDLARY